MLTVLRAQSIVKLEILGIFLHEYWIAMKNQKLE